MFVSIIIPTKNEPAIQSLVDEINKIAKFEHEIIIVDKSDDLPKLKGAVILAQKSDGLGNAFMEGLQIAEGNVIALMDGDGSHRPEDLVKMVNEIDEYDIVLGSKLTAGGFSNDALGRKIVTLAFAWLTRAVLWVDIKDPMTGFMVANRVVFNNIRLKPRGFKIIIEIVYKSKAEVKEIPIVFRERKAGSSKAGFNLRGIKESFRILALLIELKLGRIEGKW